jgi:steroid delta-isomerase-like uncharacterized protein
VKKVVFTQDNIDVVRRYIDRVVNQGDFSAVDEVCAEDMIWRGGSLGERRGLAAIKAFMAANIGAAFTEMHLEIKQIIADDETVVALFTNSGRNTGRFMGAPATGRFAKWLGTGIYLVRHGKIAEATFVEDILDLLLQLGVTALPSAGRGV